MARARFTAAAFRPFLNWISRWINQSKRLRLVFPRTRDPVLGLPPSQSRELGEAGERFAAKVLQKKGLKLLARNFRPRHGGEVDLVFRVRDRLELVFVEVKTRASTAFGDPQEAVDAEKRHRLILAAEEWLHELDQPGVVARFDIVEVIPDPAGWQIRHLENAFLARETLHPGSAPNARPRRPPLPDQPGLRRLT
jgi:putative endonuclease